MKAYYVKWSTVKASPADGAISSLFPFGGSRIEAMHDRFFLLKEKADAYAQKINEAAMLLNQLESCSSVREIDIEE
jgi:hypothetical protein